MDRCTIVHGKTRESSNPQRQALALMEPDVGAALDLMNPPEGQMAPPETLNDSTQEVVMIKGRVSISF